VPIFVLNRPLKRVSENPTGTRFCLDCANFVLSQDDGDLPTGIHGLHAKTLDDAVRHTNESVWEMCERLQYLAHNHHSEELKLREQLYGLKYIEDGLLYCRELRSIFRPVDHSIRDWMHMIVNGGVGNTQCASLIHELGEHGIPLSVTQAFLLECILPKKYGKVSSAWLNHARVKEETLSSFASIMLSVIPILA
jgi:hypothetical protein